ncbi:MAG TPA: 5-(carboxyamino)imidazole ribonucleotide synthase [Thermosynechococcaceae cyanobacterium]
MGKRIGVIGGGQLAWMMGAAAKKLGLELVVQTPSWDDPAVTIAADTILAPVADAAATAQLAAQCDVITFENEFVDLEALELLADQGVEFRPRLAALRPLLDKYHQRCYLRDLGLPAPQFSMLEEVSSPAFPIVLKTRRHGYDGQGTFIVKDADHLEATLQSLGDQPLLVEEFIPFERELAMIAARSVEGAIVTYPVVETQQERQVCQRVFAPATVEPAIAQAAEAIAHTLLESLQVVGVFGIELFLTQDGKVLVNEIAPRTHNSGHFSLDACETSQFEQHLRAVAGLPLGRVTLRSGAVMVNLLGFETSQNDYQTQRQQLAALPHTFVHWYGKTGSRPGRKLGHVTALANSEAEQRRIARTIETLWYGSDRG